MALSKTSALFRALKLDLKARAFALPDLKPYALHIDVPNAPDIVRYFFTAFGLADELRTIRYDGVSQVGIYIHRIPHGKAVRSLLSRRWSFPKAFRRYLGHANVK